MAKKNSATATFDGLLVIYGVDDEARLIAAREAVDRLIPEENRAFDYEMLDGKEAQPGAIGTALTTPPLLAERRVVRIDGAENMKKDTALEMLAALDEAATRGARDLAVIVVYAAEKLTREAKDVGERAGRKIEAGKMKAREAEAFAQRYARETHEASLPSHVGRRIVQLVGAETGPIARTLDRLYTAAPDGRWSAEDLDTIVQDSSEWATFNFCDAVGRQDGDVYDQLKDLLRDPNAAVGVSILLGRHLIKLARARAALDAGSPPRSVSASLDNRPFIAQKLMEQVDLWSIDALDHALDLLAEADLALKRGADAMTVLGTCVHAAVAAARA